VTKHSFQVWQDNNGEPANGREPQPLDAAVNTLRDVCRLTMANLSAAEALLRVQRIALAALERLGISPPAVEVEDVGGQSGLCFPDDETAFIGPEIDVEPPF
jgi:hypothetical protein